MNIDITNYLSTIKHISGVQQKKPETNVDFASQNNVLQVSLGGKSYQQRGDSAQETGDHAEERYGG